MLGWLRKFGFILVLLLAVGCSSAPAVPEPIVTQTGTSEDAPPPPPTGASTVEPAALTSAAEAVSSEPEIETEPTLGPGAGDLPYDMTGYELIAFNLGEAVYSGYSCTIAPVGCSCEEPVLERVVFNFQSEYRMSYTFAGDGYQATWEMTRLGPNQWGHTLPLYDEEGQIHGALIALLTFTADGFLYNLGADYQDGQVITCPDVSFRRVMGE